MAVFKIKMTIEISDELITESGGINDADDAGEFDTVKEFVEHEMGWIFPVNYLEKIDLDVNSVTPVKEHSNER